MSDHIKEFCGVFGIHNHPEAAHMTYLGLFALQHRGQESAGIVSTNGKNFYSHMGEGLVSDVFSNPKVIQALEGSIAIGHNRYSTTGSCGLHNVQPLLARIQSGPIAVAHNGNLVNSATLRRGFENNGAIFQTTTDSEVILHLVARSKHNSLPDRIAEACRQLKGAYSLVFLSPDSLIAVRDPNGFRPLALGKMAGVHVVASESCAFDLIGAEYVRDILPGEMVIIDSQGLRSVHFAPSERITQCIFEYIYFSRPDSRIFGDFVDKTRRKLGKNLAEEYPAEGADMVISVPDSSNTAALGYAQKSNLRFEIGLIRNHYIGRSFIHPSQSGRNEYVKLKFNTVGGVLKDRKVVVVEDSIVRGTTLRKLTKLLRAAGAAEVHIRVSSPPIKYPCFYGMDFPTRKELIAHDRTVDEIKHFLNVDSLNYLSLEKMLASVPEEYGGYCHACFDGSYPIYVEPEISKNYLETGPALLRV
ncbi:amidophosphoribosyltransferase [bacterium]|nr:amidophosphoribosyltransferase [FCB group bacterium]MBL7191323.1 amidophosphoribosyltransferase [bacterium]